LLHFNAAALESSHCAKNPLTAMGAHCYHSGTDSGSLVWAHSVRGTSMTQLDHVAVDELVREIARALVDEPAAVEVETVGRDENTILKLRVAPQDVGKMIGKQGRTARSVRAILGAVGMKQHHRYTLDILEEDE
jgi:predicted RNA-binding protein YlqC (UPF0109 family)